MSDTILDLTDESDAAEEAGGATLPAVGTQFGRYRLLRLLRSVPAAAIYEVEIEAGSHGALCLLAPEPERSSGGATAGRMTALKALREVNNPHLPAITDLIEAARPGQPEAVVMELVSGRSLAQLVTEEGPLPSERIVFILAQALDAALALQRVKLRQGPLAPETILVTSASGTDDYVRLADLALTPPADGDPGADMPAFARTLQLLLRGSPAKPSSDPLRPTLHAIARGCLSEDSPAPWRSLDELKTVFDSLLCGETVDLPGLTDPLEDAPSSPRRKRWLVAVPLAALALVGGVLLRGRGAPHPTPAPHATPVSAAAPSIPAEPRPPKPAQPAPSAPAAMTPPPPVEEGPAPPPEPAAVTAVAPAPATPEPPAAPPVPPAAAPPAPPAPTARSKPAVEEPASRPPSPEKVRPRPARPSSRALGREGTINPFGD